MKTEIENIIYNCADEIPHILIRVINAITLSDTKEELRSAINKIAEETRVCQNVHILFFMHKAPTFSSQGFAIS